MHDIERELLSQMARRTILKMLAQPAVDPMSREDIAADCPDFLSAKLIGDALKSLEEDRLIFSMTEAWYFKQMGTPAGYARGRLKLYAADPRAEHDPDRAALRRLVLGLSGPAETTPPVIVSPEPPATAEPPQRPLTDLARALKDFGPAVMAKH